MYSFSIGLQVKIEAIENLTDKRPASLFSIKSWFIIDGKEFKIRLIDFLIDQKISLFGIQY